MNTLTHRDYRGPLVEIFDWFESPWTLLHPAAGHPMRMEDYVTDGTYVVRAELPGIDPEKDADVTVSKGVLTISAHREEQTAAKHRSEFRYGTFTRSLTLPAGADEEHIQASYDKGILEVAVGLKDQESEKTQKHIPVKLNKHIKPT
jgi:HSP20 family protein